MASKLNAYFCYLNQGSPVILETEPDGFSRLPFNCTTLSPNSEIAQLIYRTHLRIMRWRFPEQPPAISR
jgi:hypothetical protein